jgi:hypothetical protein
MAPDPLWRYSHTMHHHIAVLVSLWSGLFVSFAGSAFAIVIALQAAKRPAVPAFDAAASARRIRTMPLRVSKRP